MPIHLVCSEQALAQVKNWFPRFSLGAFPPDGDSGMCTYDRGVEEPPLVGGLLACISVPISMTFRQPSA